MREDYQTQYGTNTLGVERTILGAKQPETVSDIQEIVRKAAMEGGFLYTVSTGRNWGYGGSTPMRDGCIIVDLSRMNRIVDFNPDLGLVTVEPGVTQLQLYEFLRDQGSAFMVPTTGAGPRASLLGNALDKGFGITPIEDHFAAIMALEAVLADGSIYKSTTFEFGGHRSNPIFKWKIGPYLDGLFAQSNIGIVTKVTLALSRRPDHIEQFILRGIRDSDLARTVGAIRRLRQNLGTICGGVNLMNERRVLAMMAVGDWPVNGPMAPEDVHELAGNYGLGDWIVVGALYGTKAVVQAAKKQVKHEFATVKSSLHFLNRRRLSVAQWIVRRLPAPRIQATLHAASEGLAILEGRPSSFPLRLAYLKSPKRTLPTATDSPDHDGCGLIWYAPILPMDPQLVCDFSKALARVCTAHGFDPIITFIGISERCFDTTIPIIFDKLDTRATLRARQCVDDLFQVGESFGVLPHRMDIISLARYFNTTSVTALEMISKIKDALDPTSIFSPGRYTRE